MAQTPRVNPPGPKGRRAASQAAGGAHYHLQITPHFDERRQVNTTLFVLETVQYFASFQYELSVRHDVSGKDISIHVLGLKAPALSLPAAGHARFEHHFDGLRGTYGLTVKGIDGRVNVFSVRFTTGKVQILEAPAEHFVEVVGG